MHRMGNRKPFAKLSTLGARATSLASVTLTLLIAGLLGLGAIAAARITDSVKGNLTVTVVAKPGTTATDLGRLKRTVAAQPQVAAHTFTPADSVLAQEIREMGPQTAALLEQNPFGAEFALRLKPGHTAPAQIKRLVQTLEKDKDVDTVLTPADLAADINRTFTKLAVAGGALAAVLLAISFMLINNTVSLSIYSRRFLIHTMKLVGATPSFIRRPFVTAGLTNGIVAGTIAGAMLGGMTAYGTHADPDIALALPPWPTAAVCAALVPLGAIVCGTSAWMAATRYLRRNYDGLVRR